MEEYRHQENSEANSDIIKLKTLVDLASRITGGRTILLDNGIESYEDNVESGDSPYYISKAIIYTSPTGEVVYTEYTADFRTKYNQTLPPQQPISRMDLEWMPTGATSESYKLSEGGVEYTHTSTTDEEVYLQGDYYTKGSTEYRTILLTILDSILNYIEEHQHETTNEFFEMLRQFAVYLSSELGKLIRNGLNVNAFSVRPEVREETYGLLPVVSIYETSVKFVDGSITISDEDMQVSVRLGEEEEEEFHNLYEYNRLGMNMQEYKQFLDATVNAVTDPTNIAKARHDIEQNRGNDVHGKIQYLTLHNDGSFDFCLFAKGVCFDGDTSIPTDEQSIANDSQPSIESIKFMLELLFGRS